ARELSGSRRSRRVKTVAASSRQPWSRHAVANVTVTNVSSRSTRARPVPSPAACGSARRKPRSARDSRSPGSSLTARSRWSAAARADRALAALDRGREPQTLYVLRAAFERREDLRARLVEASLRETALDENQSGRRVLRVTREALTAERDRFARSVGLAVEIR